MNWYYAEAGGQVGPFTQEQLEGFVRTGKVSQNTMVWRDGMQAWTRYGDLAKSGGTSHRCAECGNTFPEEEMIAFESAWICAGCKPVFMQKLKEGIAPVGVLRYAGFWIRVGAKMIDGIIFQIVYYCVTLPLRASSRPTLRSSHFWMLELISLTLGISYVVYFNGTYGATPGKMALKLKIVRSNGDPISYMRALGRYFAEMLSTLILGIGFMMAGWDEQKRALHDRICDTRVIRR